MITLNVNGLNAPTKRHRLAEWIQKQDPSIRCLQKTHFGSKGMQTESEGMEKDIQANGNEKKAGVKIFNHIK